MHRYRSFVGLCDLARGQARRFAARGRALAPAYRDLQTTEYLSARSTVENFQSNAERSYFRVHIFEL